MIRINLANRRQASYLGGATTKSGILASSGKSGAFSALKGFAAEADTSILKRILVPIVLVVVLYFGSDYYFEHQRELMAQEKIQLEEKKSKIQEELKRIKGFEAVKSELERNELILKTKIATIEKLIVGRDFTLKAMVALSQGLPTEVWLSELAVTDVGYTIRASTTDIGLVSDVMTRLGKTIYFKDIQLKSSSSDPTGKTATFELTARKE